MQEMVETTIDLEELDRHNFVIKPEFDEGLQTLKEGLEEVRENLDKEHRNVARDLDMDTDNKVLHFEQHSLYGYCFRLTRKVSALGSQVHGIRDTDYGYWTQEGSAIKNKSKYIELINKANGVHFTTKTLKGLNDDYKDLSKNYEKKQSSLVKEVVAIACEHRSWRSGEPSIHLLHPSLQFPFALSSSL